MENIIIKINENFNTKKAVYNDINRNILDLLGEEKNIFKNFIKNIKNKINYRNKESWWKKNHGVGKITTPAGVFFEDNNIWHIHVDENFKKDINGKLITYEIWKGNTADYIIFYKKYTENEYIILEILLMSKHPTGEFEWNESYLDIMVH